MTGMTSYRAGFGLLGLSSVAIEVVTLHERGTLQLANFLSYFTIESNLFAGVVLLAGGLLTPEPAALAFVRGAATLYLAITGVVFSLLLAGLEGVEFTAVPWDNLVLHYVMPAVIVLDWLLAPPRMRIAPAVGLTWLAFPLAYVVYSLIRGHFTHWYPYPFLNPALHGYTGVLQSSVGIALTAAVLVWVVTRLSGRRRWRGRARGPA
jgi:hypothetical protein